MGKIRIGTRDSQLASWQATQVEKLLSAAGIDSELVYIKSEGDMDLITPLYQIGVQGIFTRSLDAALLNNRIDLAVHSLKDVPVQLAKGIKHAAVLPRGSHKDLLVLHPDPDKQGMKFDTDFFSEFARGEKQMENLGPHHPNYEGTKRAEFLIATSSIRRKAQWLYRYPEHKIENLRGNVNTRLKKLAESKWHGAIFAAAGLERINLRPDNSIELDWMLPAPAQGAIVIVCREEDDFSFDSCRAFNDEKTALCTKIERDFLTALMGGCSTPISALAEIRNDFLVFKGNITSPDGKQMFNMEWKRPLGDALELGFAAAKDILANKGPELMKNIRNAEK